MRLVEATHPARSPVAEVKRFVRYGSSPRGAQAVMLAAKIEALRDGRFAPSFADVRRVALPALRHRVLLNFDGEAEGVVVRRDRRGGAGRRCPRCLMALMRRAPLPTADRGATAAAAGARFDERFLRKLESLVMTIRRSARVGGAAAREPRVEARSAPGWSSPTTATTRAGDDLRYLDWNLYGRLGRLALRLFQEDEDLLDRRAGRRQRARWRGQPAQAGSGAAGRRGAGVRRARQPGSRRGHRRSATAGAACCRPARGKGAHPADPALAGRRPRGGRTALAAAVRGVAGAAARRPARAGDRHLRFLRSGRLPRGAGSAAPPPAGDRRHPGERARGAGARRCAATSSCATSRRARRAS